MKILTQILPWIQIILSVVLIIAILVQQSAAGAGAITGGDSGSIHHTRRGFEKFVFYLTIVVAILFAVSAFLAILF